MSGPLIIGQAVIVVTEVMPGEFSVRSFGTAEGCRDTAPACSRGRGLWAGELWFAVSDGDDRARALFDRHYSRYVYADGRRPRLFVGPGEKMVLLTLRCDALFVWRRFRSMDDQRGVNCAVFRNEAPERYLSSDLIREAMALAWVRWPGERLYTYVNPRRIRSTNPGACFKAAGWRPCGVTKRRRHLILEALP